LIYYRISDNSYKKTKPPYINNQNCFLNFLYVFKEVEEIFIIADRVSEGTLSFLSEYKLPMEVTDFGNGAKSFNYVLDLALKRNPSEVIYFLEDDYLHLPLAAKAIDDGFDFAEYVTLYDHPDKYDMHSPNPHVEYGSESTRVFRGMWRHWRYTNSTTMTFLAEVSTLREDEEILRKHTSGTHPNDFEMFEELTEKGRLLVSPVPSLSTHGETQWLAPFINWEEISEIQYE
jgi:hypothetical protein